MINLAPKPRDVYDSKKKDIPTIEGVTKIPFLAIICGSIDFLYELGLKLNIGVAY
jgi:hypothetical protein